MNIETIVQSGHYLGILDIAFSPDGRLIATCSPDESIRLWDVAAGCEAAVLKGHTGPVYQICFSNDGQMLASCSWDHTVRLWNPQTRHCLHVLHRATEHPQMSVDCVAFSPSGSYVAASGGNIGDLGVPVCIWDCETGKLVRSYDVPQGVFNVVFSPDESVLAISENNDGYSVRLLDVVTGETLLCIRKEEEARLGVSNRSVSLAFSIDGRTLIFASPGEIQLFDLERKEKVAQLPSEEFITKLVAQSDGTLIAFGTRHVMIWDINTLQKLESIEVRARCMSPDGRLLARADDRYLELMDRYSCQVIRRLGSQLPMPEARSIGNLHQQFVLAANPMYPIVASAAPGGLVHLWDLRSGGGPKTIATHSAFVEGLAFDPRGNILATGGSGDAVKLWRVSDGALLHEVPLESSVCGIGFSTSGSRLVLGQSDGSITVIDTETGTKLKTVSSPTRDISAVALTPFSEETLTVSHDQLFIWDASLSKHRVIQHPLPISALAFSREGFLAIAAGLNKWMGMGNANLSQGVVSLVDPRVGFTHDLKGHAAQVRAIAFSPDSRNLVTGGADGQVIAWNVASGEKLFARDAHAGDVTGVAYTSDGRFIASIGLDAAIRLWESSTGNLAVTLISLNEEDYVAVTNQGDYSATKAGLRSVMFRHGDHIFPFEQFDLQLNRPDRVLARLDYALPGLVEAYTQAHQRRMQYLGFSPDAAAELEEIETPQIQFLSSPPIGVSEQRRIQLRVALKSARQPLDRLLIHCNDVPINGQAGIDVRSLGSGGEVSVDIELASGDNKVQLCAVDANRIESPKETFRTVFINNKPSPNLFILAVGVSRYAESSFNLEYAAKDAQDLIHEIQGLQRRFEKVESLALVDDRATRKAILESKTFLKRTRVDDHVIILFAGHGTIEGVDYFFLPTDFNPATVETTGVSYNEIQWLLDGIPARRRLILLDTCHSGEPEDSFTLSEPAILSSEVQEVRSFRNFSIKTQAPGKRKTSRIPLLDRLPDLFADLRRDSGAYVIAAAGAAEYAREFGQLKNGVFTSCVLQALREASTDLNGDGIITVSELHKFVTRNVGALTSGNQRPISRRENLTDDFPVI